MTVPTVIAAAEQGRKEEEKRGRKIRRTWSCCHQSHVGPFSRLDLDYPQRLSHYNIILVNSLEARVWV